jgi:hypothetical protein
MRQRLSFFYLSRKKTVKIPDLLRRQTYSCSGIRAPTAGQGIGKFSGIHITAFVTIVTVVTSVADIRWLFDTTAVLWFVDWAEFGAFDDSAFNTRNVALLIRTNVVLMTRACISAIAAKVESCGYDGSVCFDFSGNGGRISVDFQGNLFEGFTCGDSGFNGNSV